MSVEAVDYFSNHKLKLRFPWRLYHGPIVENLRTQLLACPTGEVLNVGSGPFFELKELPETKAKYTICDIDPRAIETARELHGSRLARADVLDPNAPLPYGDAQFDLLVTMDVIEHVPDPDPWCRELARVLKPGGTLFLTTPNYGFSTLGLIERTALEAVARFQGFSRKEIHPSKFSGSRLRSTLARTGFRDVDVRSIAVGWVLAATAKRS